LAFKACHDLEGIGIWGIRTGRKGGAISGVDRGNNLGVRKVER
jgi:hypothetical protein